MPKLLESLLSGLVLSLNIRKKIINIENKEVQSLSTKKVVCSNWPENGDFVHICSLMSRLSWLWVHMRNFHAPDVSSHGKEDVAKLSLHS